VPVVWNRKYDDHVDTRTHARDRDHESHRREDREIKLIFFVEAAVMVLLVE
jgi:hypothetical protein